MLNDEMADPGQPGEVGRGAHGDMMTGAALPLASPIPMASVRLSANERMPSEGEGSASPTHDEFGAAEAEPRRGAIIAAPTLGVLPLAANEIGGQEAVENPGSRAPDPIPMAEKAMPTLASVPSEAGASALANTCAELRALQRQRQFCIVSQSRCDRSCESFIARIIGYDVTADEKSRKAVFKRASDLRKAVEKGKGGEGQGSVASRVADALSACTPIILSSAAARAGWDTLRLNTEKRMRQLARTLPVYPWAREVAGFGDLGLAIVIGETGDLSGYATKERVWKRLGLAVIHGQRQSRRSNVEEAAEHGFSPKRRAEVWAIADSMFKHQWRGAKEDVPARAIGPYGEVYALRKAHTADREEWTPGRRDNDARRIMTKFLVENLWRVWNGKAALEPREIGEPREAA